MDAFTITLPSSTSTAQRQELESAVQGVTYVESASVSQTRGLDPASVMVWVKLAGEVLTTAGVAMPLIQKTVELIRGKGIKGAKINLPGGATVQVDEASSADIERLVKAAAGG